MSKISVVILNHKRPDNIKNIILPIISKYDIIEEIIISHSLPETIFDDKINKKIIHINHIEENKEYSVFRRFLAARESKTDCIMFLDDDCVINNKSINRIYNFWTKDKNLIHGKFGRDVKINEYIMKDSIGKNVPIIITKFAITSRIMVERTIENYDKINPFVRNCNPIWNGEDIFLSMLSVLYNKKLNKIYECKSMDLLDNDAIWKIPGHLEHRSFLVSKIFEVFPELISIFKLNNYNIT
jgi:hypothetical protein